jgi:NitT/TauT family transport system substrate-binding protein
MKMRTIRLRLLWRKQAQFAGYLMAEALGFGREEGIAIECQEIDFASPHVAAVLAGSAEAAVASPAHVLESNDPDALRVVLVIQQASPLVYPVRATSPIRSLQDLSGQPIAVWPGNESLELRWMLHQAGLQDHEIRRVESADTVAALIEGRAAAAQMTTYHELHQAEAALGRGGLRVFRPTPDQELVKDGLVVSRRMAKEEPSVVQALVNASLRGWNAAFEDPEQAVAICARARPDMSKDEHRTQLADIRALVRRGPTLMRGLGYPDPIHEKRARTALEAIGHPVGHMGAVVIDSFWAAAPEAYRPCEIS